MNYLRPLLISLFLLMSLSMINPAHSTPKELYKASDVSGTYTAPTKAENRYFRTLFDQLMQTGHLRSESLSHGLFQKTFSSPNWTALGEQQIRGWGFYLFRQKRPDIPIMLQAPHRYYDKKTGSITYKLFQEGDFTVAAWNTLSRRSLAQDGTLADFSKQQFSPWFPLNRSFLKHYPQGLIVQIHGFNETKRKTSQGKQSRMIISAGSRIPSQESQKLVQCLKTNPHTTHPETIRLYPFAVQELGATTNVIGQWTRRLGSNRFIHIELSRTTREKLIKSKKARRILIDCLMKVATL
ncbi:hypothetical protein ACQZV8_02160 [Magnetococcales bacterium HHB-1]